MVKAVVFDLDDTLISERQYVESGYHHVSGLLSKRLGRNKNELYRLLLALFAEDSSYVFNRLLDRLGVAYTSDTVLELVQEYRGHHPTIQFYDDVLPCLTDLKTKGIKTGIITDGFACAQRNKLEAVSAYYYFDEIIVTDELGREYWKPHPKPFEIMRELLDVKFDQMVYVGDNPEKDFYIANVYPIRTVRINRDGIHRENKYFENVSETLAVSKLTDLSSFYFNL